jgi:hypothetical protein
LDTPPVIACYNVNHKIRRLEIVEENANSNVSFSSSNLVIPDEQPSDEEPLKICI